MVTPIKFPLSKDHFGTVKLTFQQEDNYRHIVQTRVDAALAEEYVFAYVRKWQVNGSKWRRVRSKHKFTLFKHTNNSLDAKIPLLTTENKPRFGGVEEDLDNIRYDWYNHTSDELLAANILSIGSCSEKFPMATDARNLQSPSMLGLGCVEGNIHDLLFGWYSHSHQQLQATLSLLDRKNSNLVTLDASVLHTIETATPHDPLHYLGLKWALSRTSTSHARDYCCIDAVGISRDQQGNCFGYIVMESTDIPNCPPFPQHVAIRATCSFTFILRQQAAGTVDVFSLGYFDAKGDTAESQRFSTVATKAILSRVMQAMHCSQVKKLTLLATHNGCDITQTAGRHSSTERCGMCRKRKTIMFRSSLKTCRVCRSAICRKCSTNHQVLAPPLDDPLPCSVTCCIKCIIKVKNMAFCYK